MINASRSVYHPKNTSGRASSLAQWLRKVLPSFGPPDVFRLQLLEILASAASGEGFWGPRWGTIAREAIDESIMGRETSDLQPYCPA